MNFLRKPERWKRIMGKPHYKISSWGKVKRIKGIRCSRDRVLKNVIRRDGYIWVSLYAGPNTKELIHRLVAIHFVPNPKNLPEVNHEDGIKSNNYYENLIWTTHKDNIQHSWDNLPRKRNYNGYNNWKQQMSTKG